LIQFTNIYLNKKSNHDIEKEKCRELWLCLFYFFWKKYYETIVSNHVSNFDWYLYIGFELFCCLYYLFAPFQKNNLFVQNNSHKIFPITLNYVNIIYVYEYLFFKKNMRGRNFLRDIGSMLYILEDQSWVIFLLYYMSTI